ncbi:MAG TPA: hypothetical protein VNN80_08815 [Polyangiaceae bacterium]|jgi:hypothetical protein|nr:hypothetical protein [Polyangiaceae bacterium]
MTELTYSSFGEQLRAAVPGFERVYNKHLADNGGEVLPYVLLGDLVPFLSQEVAASRGEESRDLKHAMLLLERAMGSEDRALRDLVAVAFIEYLEPEDPSFPVIRKLFGPQLEEEYRSQEAWLNARVNGSSSDR